MTPGDAGDDPPELIEPPDREPPSREPRSAEPAPTEPIDRAAPDPPPTEPVTAAPAEPPATEPVDATDLPAEPAFVGIDSWLDAPAGTFPGLADAGLAEAGLAEATRDPTRDDLAAVFADDRFRHYDADDADDAQNTAEQSAEPSSPRDPVAAGVSPFGMPPDDAPGARGPVLGPRAMRAIVGVSVAVIVVVALIAAFVGGRAAAGATAGGAPTAPRSATPRATPVPALTALASPGVVAWDRLAGGECLTGYSDPWAQTFTVVACDQPHTAQLVIRATLPDAASAAYPGSTALEQRMPALCTAPGVVDLAAAGRVTDLQYAAAYPATRGQWAGGQRDYFCFVSRSSGATISGSIAGPAHEEAWAARAKRTPSPTPSSTRH